MATDAEIEAAVKAMRAIRTSGGKVHDEVLRAYARAALDAAELVQIAERRRRTEGVAPLEQGVAYLRSRYHGSDCASYLK